MSGTTQFFKNAAASTTRFLTRAKAKANTSVLVGGFIGSASTATEIIEAGIAGKPISVWHGVKFLFFFTLAMCHSHGLWKADPNAVPRMSESEWLRSQLAKPTTPPP